MVLNKNLLNKEKISISCTCCDYIFEFDYKDLKSDESLVFCPLCYTEKTVSSKEEIASYLVNTIENINKLIY